jgi:hypothetical protein
MVRHSESRRSTKYSPHSTSTILSVTIGTRFASPVASRSPRSRRGSYICTVSPNTDALTKAAAERKLAELGVTLKSSDAYLAVVETCELPTGDGSLCEWLKRARTIFEKLIDGAA